MSVLYSSQNQLHSKSQQIWKNKVQTTWRGENCLQVTKLILSQSASPSQLGEVLVNPVALSMLGVQPMLTILKTREGFTLAENGFQSQGKSFEGREKNLLHQGKIFHLLFWEKAEEPPNIYCLKVIFPYENLNLLTIYIITRICTYWKPELLISI